MKMQTKKNSSVVVKEREYMKFRKKRNWILYSMLLPGAIYLIINNYIPMAGLSLAFKKYDYNLGMWGSPWNGIKNFLFLFKTRDAAIMIRNTLLYNLVFIILGHLMAVAVAIGLNEVRNKVAKNVYQIFILIPYLISMVVVSYIVYALLATDTGFINNLLGTRINWYVSEKYWPYIFVIVYLWKNFGYSSIIYYATLIGIDSSLYEAASVDGATKWGKILHVTIPGLKNTIITLVLLNVGKIFYSDFGLFYQVPQNSGLLYDVTTTIDVYVYRGLTQMNDIGRASAAGFLQSILGFILVMTANYVVNKIDKESALF